MKLIEKIFGINEKTEAPLEKFNKNILFDLLELLYTDDDYENKRLLFNLNDYNNFGYVLIYSENYQGIKRYNKIYRFYFDGCEKDIEGYITEYKLLKRKEKIEKIIKNI